MGDKVMRKTKLYLKTVTVNLLQQNDIAGKVTSTFETEKREGFSVLVY